MAYYVAQDLVMSLRRTTMRINGLINGDLHSARSNMVCALMRRISGFLFSAQLAADEFIEFVHGFSPCMATPSMATPSTGGGHEAH